MSRAVRRVRRLQTAKAVVLDGITNKPVPVNPTYSVVSGTATISGSQITCGSSTGSVTVRAVATGAQYFTSSADTTFNITNKQGQTIFFKQGEKGGLRDLPLSRKPTPLGRMATATSNLEDGLISGFLQKPFTPNDLRTAIEEILRS